MILQKIIDRVWIPFVTKLYTRTNCLKCKLYHVEVGIHFKTRGIIYFKNYGKIKIGNHVTMNSASWANPIGLGDRMYFQIFQGASVTIGDNTGISNTAITSMESIKIGNHVLIGAGCKIFDTDFHPLETEYRYGKYKNDNKVRKRSIVIEDGVFIGGGSFILKGSHIGKNSIIGAGSVVVGKIPPNEIWAGNPAKFIRKIDEATD
ncbi:acyltransferase [Neobacillus drentensis]|uniref:acyltransferase n=1 Tax=Neobacillus drentensis TaxID=220684 RepID=UPI001F2989F4|nr:acyltransferase [Neobacillus drentensis]ULT56203.1 acyltransferase [Neobacillus drentensis]